MKRKLKEFLTFLLCGLAILAYHINSVDVTKLDIYIL